MMLLVMLMEDGVHLTILLIKLKISFNRLDKTLMSGMEEHTLEHKLALWLIYQMDQLIAILIFTTM